MSCVICHVMSDCTDREQGLPKWQVPVKSQVHCRVVRVGAPGWRIICAVVYM